MPPDITEDRLVHYFAGELSAEEAAEIEAWMEGDPERKRRVARLRRIWDAAERPPDERPNVEAMWDRLTRRMGTVGVDRRAQYIQQGAARRARHGRRDRHRGLVRRLFGTSVPISVAAVVIGLVVLAVWFFSERSPVEGQSPGMREIATEAGQRARISLGDGTQIILNGESLLTLPPEFAEDERLVTLRGEAYFDVAQDAARPFLVQVDGAEVRVLGTQFDVGAYPSDEIVRVVVAEGKVVVRSKHPRSSERLTLSGRQMATLSERDEGFVHRDVDPFPYLAWTKGQLVFRDARFDEVARRLRSWYGIPVEFVGSSESVDRLNATFTDEPVSEALSIIAETLDLRYEREGRSVIYFVRQ